MPSKTLKILFLYNTDWFFWNYRYALADALVKVGFEVILIAPVPNRSAEFSEKGIRVIPWNLSRQSMNPFREFMSFLQIYKIYSEEHPDIVHHEAMKPIIYGGIAARLENRIPSANTICGLGSIFTRATTKLKFLRFFLLRFLAIAFGSKDSHVIFMNEDNRDLLLGYRTVRPERLSVVHGSGVPVDKFTVKPEPEGVPIVLLPSRMLWEKGISEFVSAAKDLKEKGVLARFVLAGAPDSHNPGCVPERQLEEWERSGVVEWWRHRNDMPAVYSQATLICLPSYYGEGLPNVLVEAGASGRPVITTTMPGCRQAVADGLNGLLVPPRDSVALSVAIEKILGDPQLRKRLGAAGRERAVREFSQEVIVKQMIEIFQSLLRGKWPPPHIDSASQPDATACSQPDRPRN